ncbi:hypothetical protein ACFYZT_32440 [Streptomyces sp. NPDC001591]|uniref:hypothetical protein n=1 Tax=Streptomyces sp. NPDC001591 TaxID=3364589 RepID=UPI0036BC765A
MRGWHRLDRGTLRAGGFVALLTVTFLMTNTAVAAAATADGSGPGGGLLGPLDIMTGEGVPLSSYQLEAMPIASQPQGGIPAVDLAVTGRLPDLDVIGDIQRLVLGGLFTLVRLLVGLCGWLISFVFRFPLITMLTRPAQQIADAYERHVVAPLGLEGLLLAWAFVFGLILFVRGKAGTGLGEIALTLVIAALAASVFVRPDYLLGKDGPLDQTHQAAVEVASITTASYFGTPARGGRPCDSAVGPAHEACVKEKAEAKTVVDPVQHALTDSLVVKPYMLLQYGRVLDPHKAGEADAYKAHLKWVKSNQPQQERGDQERKKEDKCSGTIGPLKEECERQVAEADGGQSGNPECKSLIGSAKGYCKNPCKSLDKPARDYCENGNGPRGADSKDEAFSQLIKDLEDAGPVGQQAAQYAQTPTWDRVWSVVALLVAVLVVTLMIVSMAVVMLGAQGADAAAAAGGPIAWVWSMLPGPSRMLLWRWAGVFIASALVSFVAALCLPMFGIAVDAVLSDSDTDLMVERLLLVDAIAVAFLVMHRRVLAATAGFGQRMATRMRYRKIGGSHLRGDSSEIGAALAEHGPAGGGLGRRDGQPSTAHGAFGARLASLGSLAAMSDGAGMPMSPSRFIGDALAEGKRGLAPFAVALRMGHAALIGPKPGQHPASQALAGAASGTGGGSGEVVADQWTGEILHDPATDRPLLGSRIHARASRLRGYRVASRTARLAYGATLGLPRNLGHARGAASEFTDDARTQLRVAAHQVREDADRWADGGRLVRDGVDHAGQRLATTWQVHDPMGSVRDTAVAAAIATAPLAVSSRGRESTVRTSVSAPHAEAGRAPRPRRRPAEPAATPPQASAQEAGSAAGAAEQQAANAARLRAIFDARAAELRRREGGER